MNTPLSRQAPMDRALWSELMKAQIAATRDAAAASVAGGLIAAIGRVLSPDEAAALMRACRRALYPARSA